MHTIRERCKHCGKLDLWQIQRTIDGRDELVAIVARICPARSLAPETPSRSCEAETRADRMSRSTSKRISRRLGFRR